MIIQVRVRSNTVYSSLIHFSECGFGFIHTRVCGVVKPCGLAKFLSFPQLLTTLAVEAASGVYTCYHPQNVTHSSEWDISATAPVPLCRVQRDEAGSEEVIQLLLATCQLSLKSDLNLDCNASVFKPWI